MGPGVFCGVDGDSGAWLDASTYWPVIGMTCSQLKTPCSHITHMFFSIDHPFTQLQLPCSQRSDLFSCYFSFILMLFPKRLVLANTSPPPLIQSLSSIGHWFQGLQPRHPLRQGRDASRPHFLSLPLTLTGPPRSTAESSETLQLTMGVPTPCVPRDLRLLRQSDLPSLQGPALCSK